MGVYLGAFSLSERIPFDRMVVWVGDSDPKGHHEAATMDGDGRWVAFAMNLGDREHQAAFRAGRVADGAVEIARIEGAP